MEAVAKLRLRDLEAERPYELSQRGDAFRVRSRRKTYVEALADAQHVAAVDMAPFDPVEFEMIGQAGGGGIHFADP